MAKDRIVIPGIPTDAARVIIERLLAQDERLAILERRRGRAGVVTSDTAAKVGELLNIEAPTDGLTIVLPTSTQALRNARVTLSFRNSNPVRIVCVLGTVNGEAFVLNDRPGTYDAICDGIGGWAVQVGVSEDGSGAGGGGGSSATGAEYVLGASDASLPNGRVATDSTEIDAVLTTPNVITWALNVASVALSKLANLAGLSVLGRATNSSGVMAAITATAGSQKLVTNPAGTAVVWESDLPSVFTDSVTGSVGTYDLPSTFRSGDTLRLTLTGNTTIVGFTIGGAVPAAGTEFNLCLSDQSGGSAPGWTLTIPDAGGGAAQFRTPGQVQGTTPGPSYVMQSEEEGARCAFQEGAWRIIGGTAAQAITGDITVASGNGATRTAAITAGVIVNADVNASAAIDQTKLGATTGFSVKASGASATTSAEPIVTYSASSNMSAERVTTSSTSVTVSTSVASQIEFQRAALSGAIAASANANTTLFSGIRDNGAAENDRTNLNFVSGTNTTATVTDDAGNDELEIRFNVDDLPLSALADQAEATVLLRAVSAGTGVPIAGTGVQLGEIVRLGTVETEATGGSILSYALGAGGNFVNVTATAQFHGIAGGASGRLLIIFNGAAFGSGVIVDLIQFSSSASGGSGEKILTPTARGTNSVGVRLHPGAAAVLIYTSSRWRVMAVSLTPVEALFLNPENTTTGEGMPFLVRKAFAATGATGTMVDVTVWNASAPFALRIVRAELRVSTAAGTAAALRTAAAGGGSVVLPDVATTTQTFDTSATGHFVDNAAATATVSASGSAFFNVDRAVAGELLLWCIPT